MKKLWPGTHKWHNLPITRESWQLALSNETILFHFMNLFSSGNNLLMGLVARQTFGMIQLSHFNVTTTLLVCLVCLSVVCKLTTSKPFFATKLLLTEGT